MLALLNKTLVKWVSIILVAVAIVVGSYHLGAYNEKQVQEIKDQKEYIDTTKRIDNAPTSTNRDDAIERLREMGDLR